jgi:uncharacterized phage-associated protein
MEVQEQDGAFVDEVGLGSIRIKYEFNEAKAENLLAYLLRGVGGSYAYMALLKLTFFADRYHVRTYAAPVSGDEYVAMKLGPVPSNCYRLLKSLPLNSYHLRLSDERAIDEDWFSVTEREALDFSLQHFGELGKRDDFALADLTHAYPEWKKYAGLFEGGARRVDIDYRDFLRNADRNDPMFRRYLIEDPYPMLGDEEIAALEEELLETSLMTG